MAIDPSISLNVRPPVIQPLQIQNPLEQYGKILTLRNLMQEQQSGQIGLQAQQLKLQQEQQSVKDADLLRQSYIDAGGDLDKTGTLLRQRGGSPQALINLQKQHLDVKKTLAEIGDKELAVHKDRDEKLSGLVYGALQMPDDQYAAQWPQLRASAVAINPELDSKLPATALPKTDLQSMGLQFNTTTGLLAQETARRADAKERRDTAEAAAKLPGVQADTAAKVRQVYATILAPALARGVDSFQAALAEIAKTDPAGAAVFAKAGTPRDVLMIAQTPTEQITAQQAAATAAETARHNLSTESTAKLNAAIAGGRLAQERMINGMKYGAGTQEYWVQQIHENPDSIKEMPAELRSSVGQAFKQATGLPLPTALPAATQTQETAARNALDGITFIKQAMQNPEIRAQIGPIMGRLGNAEQALGTAAGLSPEAAALAQELRTRMRYFVFQEGKAVLGGRLPQKLMEALESSSASVKMEPDMLQGALKGAEGNAQSVLDNADKQRFGGKMRSRETRGAAAQQNGAAVPEAVKNVLKGVSPGLHTLSDGSVWKTTTDGKIEKQ